MFAFTVFLEAYLDLDDPEVRLRRFRVFQQWAVGRRISELWSVYWLFTVSDIVRYLWDINGFQWELGL